MAKKANGEVPRPKLLKGSRATGIDFVGTWVSIMRAFEGADVGRGIDSYWTILPGNKLQESNGRLVDCIVKGKTIKIPYGTKLKNFWVGEMREDGKLVISTSNGMMQYLCARTQEEV